MKVLCIETKFVWKTPSTRNYEPTDPKYGEVCTVLNQMNYNDLFLYKLEGYSEWYDSRKFIPISDIDETTFERNYKTETQPV